jgi:radical SAM protein with 4Fe4S-binding SPASM domain
MYKRLANTYQILKTFTVSRALNAFRVWKSFRKAKNGNYPLAEGLPFSISIEPTTSCNLRCPECPSGLRSFTRPTGMLSVALFKKTIDKLAHHVNYLTFYFQGEPYLHNNFLEMVAYASAKNIYTATSTNAHYLKESTAEETVKSGLKKLIISIDGTSQDTYQSYRVGGSLEKVIEGTKAIVNAKRKLKSATPYVVFQFLVVKPNEHQIPEVYTLAKKLGVDEVKLKSAQIYDFENGSPLIPKQEKYSRYRLEEDGRYQIKNKFENNCWKMWHSCVITWDGKVLPCCFDKDAQYSMGNLQEQSFEEIWFGEKYQQFRNTLFNSRKEIEICKNCTEGTQVWV